MNIDYYAFNLGHQSCEAATHPIARLSGASSREFQG